MHGIKHINTTEQNNIRVIVQEVKKDIKISDWLFDYIVTIGDNTDYEVVVYYDLTEKIFFDVNDLIEYIEENIIDQAEDREDYEVEEGNKAIKELQQWKGWRLYED